MVVLHLQSSSTTWLEGVKCVGRDTSGVIVGSLIFSTSSFPRLVSLFFSLDRLRLYCCTETESASEWLSPPHSLCQPCQPLSVSNLNLITISFHLTDCLFDFSFHSSAKQSASHPVDLFPHRPVPSSSIVICYREWEILGLLLLTESLPFAAIITRSVLGGCWFCCPSSTIQPTNHPPRSTPHLFIFRPSIPSS